MATEAPQATAQPKTREEPEYVQAAISELERTEGRNIREVDASSTVELAASIEERGVLEPVLVTRTPKGLRLVAGFRRVAAAKSVGMKSVPARILELNELEVLESQLVENVQRKDLSPIEEAKGLKALLEASGLTQEAIGKKIGKSQSYVANRIGLLHLPAQVQKLMESGKLSASHAEVLTKLPESEAQTAVLLAAETVNEGHSVAELNVWVTQRVRELEDLKRAETQAAERKKKFEESLKTLKFPKCPKCGKTATELTEDGFLEHGDYQDTHHWKGSTGKTRAQMVRDEEAKEQARWRAQAGRRGPAIIPERPRPKPVDCRESPLLRSGHDPMAIALAVLKGAGTAGIELLEYDRRASGAVLRIGLTGRPLGEVHVIARPVAYSTGERTQFVVQNQLAPQRKASKSTVQTWERKTLSAPKLKPGKAPTFDAAQLKGTAGTVTTRLAKIRASPELLEIARSAEAEGKHRAAVLDWIDEQLGGRAHDSFDSYSTRARL